VHVPHGETQEELLRVALVVELLPELLVVGVAGGEGLLEDGRVRGDTDHGVVLHEPGELSRAKQVAREIVDPDALPEL
jgi:hypothetical protein